MSDDIFLDRYDLRLLALLQADAAKSVVQMAAEVNLSQNACWRRIKRLEEAGFILKRVALLDPNKLQAGVTVFVSIRSPDHSDQWLADFTAAVEKMPQVVEFYRMSGDVDYLLKVQVADIASYDLVYKNLIRQVRLADVSSAFAMEELKHTTEVPLPQPNYHGDAR